MHRLGLIVGGVQKAGTSSLFQYLRQHPQLLAPTKKELHVFDYPETAENPREAIARYFPPNVAVDRIPFDTTPIYLYWPGALERIRAHNASVRLVFLFRDPIERAWSHWRMSRLNGSETMSFSAAIRDGRERLRSPDGGEEARRRFSYVERGFYGEQVSRLLSLFSRDQVLLLRSRDLADARLSALNGIAAWLGIAPFTDLAEHRALWSPAEGPIEDADITHLRALFAADTARFADLTGLDVSDWTSVNPDAPLWRPSAPA